jgi:hypothetical protein
MIVDHVRKRLFVVLRYDYDEDYDEDDEDEGPVNYDLIDSFTFGGGLFGGEFERRICPNREGVT